VTDRGTATGSRNARRLRAVAAVVPAGAALLLLAAPAGAASGGGTYGSLPAWLPKASVQVGRVVTASSRHPSLAIEGDTVRAVLAHGHSLVTAVGPAVPEEGQVPVPATTPCTFTVTFADTAGSVPLETSAFTITDEEGRVHHPVVSVTSGAGLPARVRTGRIVSLTMSTVLPTGAGTLHWAPAGGRALVSWDFDVEID
jgi:hypothetical protein